MSGERADTRRKMESFEGMLRKNGAQPEYARAKAREMARRHDDGAVKKRERR